MSVFYVYQGATFNEELEGGFVWSPKLNKKGGKTEVFSQWLK